PRTTRDERQAIAKRPCGDAFTDVALYVGFAEPARAIAVDALEWRERACSPNAGEEEAALDLECLAWADHSARDRLAAREQRSLAGIDDAHTDDVIGELDLTARQIRIVDRLAGCVRHDAGATLSEEDAGRTVVFAGASATEDAHRVAANGSEDLSDTRRRR